MISESPKRHVLALAGVFLAGLGISTHVLDAALLRAVAHWLPNHVVLFSIFTFPLTVYAVLYVCCLFPRSENIQLQASLLRSVAIYSILVIGTLFVFPYVIQFLGCITLPLSFAALAVAPFVSGVLYGIFLAFLSAWLKGWKELPTPRAHAIGGGMVGAFVLVHYLFCFNSDGPVEPSFASQWPFVGSVLLTLCYVPHLLATRPWLEREAHAPRAL